MRQDALFVLLGLLAVVVVLWMGSMTPTAMQCPQATEIVRYYPVPEPQPLLPTPALPSMETMPLVVEAAPDPKAGAQESVAEAAPERETARPARRSYHRRYYRVRRRYR